MAEPVTAADAAEINAVVERLASGIESPDDRRQLLRAWRVAQLNVKATEQSVAVGGNVIGSTITIAPHIFEGASADAIRQELEKERRDRYRSSLRAYSEGFRDYVPKFSPPLLRNLWTASDDSSFEHFVPLRLRPLPNEHGNNRHGAPAFAVAHEAGNVPGVLGLATRGSSLPHVFIVGEPGSGKTSLLQEVAAKAWDDPTAIGLGSSHLVMLVRLRWLAQAHGTSWARLFDALRRGSALFVTRDPPDDFFDEWSKLAEAPWLLLFDGLDNVPQGEDRDTIIDWLETLMDQAAQAGHHVILTTRPTSRQPSLEAKSAVYEILPFDDAQKAAFAHRAFGPELGGTFLKELERVRAGALIGTPLLLAIAAAVRRQKGEVPRRRAALYDQCVGYLLGLGRSTELERDLGPEPSELMRHVLERLALASTAKSGAIGLNDLQRAAEAFVREAVEIAEIAAGTDSRRLVDAIRRHSGILQCRDDQNLLAGVDAVENRCEWSHQTFREYLAASGVARTSQLRDEPARKLLARWRKPVWREVILFLLGAWSEGIGTKQAQDVSDALADIAKKGAKGRLFAAAALAEGVRVSEAVADRLVEELLVDARDVRSLKLHDFPHLPVFYGPDTSPVEALGTLTGWKRAITGLRDLGLDSKAFVKVRIAAAMALENQGQPQAALEILRRVLDEFGDTIPSMMSSDILTLAYAYTLLARNDQQILAEMSQRARDVALPPEFRLAFVVVSLRAFGDLVLDNMRTIADEPELASYCAQPENRDWFSCRLIREELAILQNSDQSEDSRQAGAVQVISTEPDTDLRRRDDP